MFPSEMVVITKLFDFFVCIPDAIACPKYTWSTMVGKVFLELLMNLIFPSHAFDTCLKTVFVDEYQKQLH